MKIWIIVLKRHHGWHSKSYKNATEENKQLDLYDAVSILVARYLLAKKRVTDNTSL
ncbi:hypothetical protein [Xenorhabdus nematophila]|uniref:hypothetical protein n=1 Tax=Xenorhabdus nematophila TaxID=628 RepID=UPI000B270A48|nr:hypothetical protein [Xenorhabdus nematophila]